MFLPWYAQGRLLQRSREIASAFARHGLGWLLAHVGLAGLVPFERGWLGHPVRHSPYTQAEHLRMALGEVGATFIKLGQAGLEAAELGLALPRRVSRLLDRVEQGNLEVTVNHDGLRQFTRELQRMTNRLSLAILLAATIVALGLVMLVYHPPGWKRLGSLLLALAFFFSLGFGAWLMWHIWRSGR